LCLYSLNIASKSSCLDPDSNYGDVGVPRVKTLPAEAVVTWLDVAYDLLEVVSLFAFGRSPAGRISRTQNCTLVGSVCLSALEATWTSAPDLVESDASAETATSNVTIVNGNSRWRSRRSSREILLAICPRGDAFASLLMLLCREPRRLCATKSFRSRSRSTPIACHPMGALQIVCVVEYSQPNAGFKS